MIACDPGKKGAIARIEDDFCQVLAFNGKPARDLACIRSLYCEGDSIWVESVHAIHGTSASSNFSFGRSVGFLDGILWSTGIKGISYIPPKVWQKAIGVVGYKESKDRKAALIEKAQSLFPGLDLKATPRCTTPHSGMADAILMAYVATHLLK